MAQLDFPTLSPGLVVAERYEVLTHPNAPAGFALARDREGVGVQLVALTEAEAERAGALVAFEHAHVVPVREVVQEGDTHFLVTSAVEGTTLATHVEHAQAQDPITSVRWALRLADALHHLHDEGQWHGRLHPGSVVIESDADVETPLLTYSPPHGADAYRLPERESDGEGSPEDDAWALGALLYRMLTGTNPPAGGVASAGEVESAGIEDEALRELLVAALNADPSERNDSLRPLRRGLARWYVRHADEDAHPEGQHSTSPPPLPASLQPSAQGSGPPEGGVSSPRPVPPDDAETRRRVPFLAVVGVVLGLGVAWGATSFLGSESSDAVAENSPPPDGVAASGPSASAEPAAIDLSEVAVTGDEEKTTGDEMATCVAGYLPASAFDGSAQLAWICKETDAASGATKLKASVGKNSDAKRSLDRMGSAAQIAFAAVRRGCCVDAPPLDGGGDACKDRGAALESAGRAVVDGGDLQGPLETAEKALACDPATTLSTEARDAFRSYVAKLRAE